MTQTSVPDVVIRRLTTYLQTLKHMAQRGEHVASSTEIGRWAGVSPAQVRKDLSHFGEFGRQGLGYEIGFLCTQIERILKIDQDWRLILVGAGALGHALMNYGAFVTGRFQIVAVFDSDPAKVNTRVGQREILPMERLAEIIAERHVEIAILAVPATAAQHVADQLVACGVRSILSYAPITLNTPRDVHVRYIDPVASLQTMTYYL
ncbi:MAG: redox-sensing transcriptional repressor Rex [Chloroflexi bacterium]|jgi:redox-sensing transcriptional repressor|nr:redox-sensing transcriptional repressor Rex [Chloroflexota bacterium]